MAALVNMIPGLSSSSTPQYLTGDKASIDAFIARFDVLQSIPSNPPNLLLNE